MTKEVKVLLGCLAAVIGIEVANKITNEIIENYKDEADSFIEANRSDEIKKIADTFDDLKEKAEAITDSQDEAVRERLEKFKNGINYDLNKAKAKEKAKQQIEAFKESISYDEQIKNLEETFEEKVENYKLSTGYDNAIEKLNDKIKTAKDDYESKKAVYKILADEETASELKKGAKKVRNANIKECEESIKKLEDKLKEFTDEASKTCSEGKQELMDKLSEAKLTIYAERDKILDELDDQVATAERSIYSDITSKMTEEERAIIDQYNHDGELYIAALKKEIEDRDLLVANATKGDKIALYLHNKGWKGWQVKAALYSPLSIVVYACYRYIKWANRYAAKVVAGGLIYRLVCMALR